MHNQDENISEIFDFIGVFDQTLDTNQCNQIVEYFETLKLYNLTYNRQQSNDAKKHEKDDETAFILEPYILQNHSHPIFSNFLHKFWNNYQKYADIFTLIEENTSLAMSSLRIQKTIPGQGFHKWHFESYDRFVSNRVVAWSLFLNDVDYGGEMEFLYYSKRIKAKLGRLVIWPAGFTHVHRGNPPLSGEKYILTGWLEFWS
jgi:hypothetical protein